MIFLSREPLRVGIRAGNAVSTPSRSNLGLRVPEDVCDCAEYSEVLSRVKSKPLWILAPCGKPYRTRGGNKKPCVFPRSRLRFTQKPVQTSARFGIASRSHFLFRQSTVQYPDTIFEFPESIGFVLSHHNDFAGFLRVCALSIRASYGDGGLRPREWRGIPSQERLDPLARCARDRVHDKRLPPEDARRRVGIACSKPILLGWMIPPPRPRPGQESHAGAGAQRMLHRQPRPYCT